MKKLALSTLALTSLFAITACSSGGGSNSSPNNASTMEKNPNQSSQSNQDIQTDPPVIKGTVFLVGKTSRPVSEEPKTTDFNQLVVNGKSIPLAYEGISSGRFIKLQGNIISDSHLNNVKYGYVAVDENTMALFVQGSVTPESNVPTSGTANYQGYAVKIGYTPAETVTANSNFTVDFANKTLEGTIIDDNQNNLANIKAAIQGNSFSGNYDNVNTNGYFYGKNAQELGGYYAKTVGAHKHEAGVFGATRK